MYYNSKATRRFAYIQKFPWARHSDSQLHASLIKVSDSFQKH